MELIQEQPLLISPTLANRIGLENALVLQQIYGWLSEGQEVNIQKISECFYFLHENEIEKSLTDLTNLGLIYIALENKKQYYKADLTAIIKFLESAFPGGKV